MLLNTPEAKEYIRRLKIVDDYEEAHGCNDAWVDMEMDLAMYAMHNERKIFAPSVQDS